MDSDQPAMNDPEADPAVIDDAFLVLRDRSRRYVCYFLLEHETASLSEVADVVSGWLYAANGCVVEPHCRRQRYRELVHTHIPKLVDTGVVHYDETNEMLSLSPCPDPIREFATRACAMETGT